MFDDIDKEILYEIRDALIGTLDKPGLINKVNMQHEDIYGKPHGIIERLGKLQEKQNEDTNKIKGGWTTLGLIGMVAAWIYTTFIKK